MHAEEEVFPSKVLRAFSMLMCILSAQGGIQHVVPPTSKARTSWTDVSLWEVLELYGLLHQGPGDLQCAPLLLCSQAADTLLIIQKV